MAVPTFNKEACIMSYNSRGFSAMTSTFIQHLVSQSLVGNKIPILCNQENFILRDNSYKLVNALPGFQLVINPAVKSTLDSGRPRNGMFIAFPNSIKNNICDVSPGFWRVQAIKIKFLNSSLLLINTYFPTDPRRANCDETDLQETIGHIKEVIRKNDFDDILWAGDINSDFLRNTSHTNQVSDSVEELGLTKSWDTFEADFTCYHEIAGVCHTSVLDHFFWNYVLGGAVTDAGVIHHPDNRSDHCPIYCVLSLEGIHHDKAESSQKQQQKPSWKRASQEEKQNFKNLLEDRLNSLTIPQSVLECRDVKCRDTTHRVELDSFAMDLLETLQEIAETSLPMPAVGENSKAKGQSNGVIPGWKEAVKPFKDKAYFWHQVWVSLGRPINTEIHKVMRRSKNKYHHEFKKCRKAEEKIKKSKLLDACLNGGGDLFKEIKSMRKSNSVVATSMDGVQNNVTDHFREKYEKLFNSTDDGTELLKVQKLTETRVFNQSMVDIMKVTPDVVKEAAQKLKPGKSDPIFSFSSDCFKNAPDALYVKLTNLLQGFLVHGHVTLVLLLATLVPIIKDKLGSINVSKNYRSIAISSLLLKLIDWIFLILFGSSFRLNDFQFAYQAGCSTTMCTWAVVETVDYFLRNGSEVYSCAMDMTAAFDLTLHSLLFSKMLKAGFPPVFLRLFIFIYIHQVANVKWDGELSSLFTMTNGVRQGAVLSAIAYCFYCEDLFTLLKNRRTGCWILNEYHGIFG